MDLIEALNGPYRVEPPYGPRSQGGRDEHYVAELEALLSIPSLSCERTEVDERSPPLLRAVHLAQHPDVAVFPQERIDDEFAKYLLDLRETYRALHSPGKRPWPAFMQAAQDGQLSAADCDAVFAMTGVHCAGIGDTGIEIGDFLAGSPLDTTVLDGDGKSRALLDVLPPVVPVNPASLKGPALYRAAHATACKTRVQGASGYRRMTRDELLSEVARRSAEITDARKNAAA